MQGEAALQPTLEGLVRQWRLAEEERSQWEFENAELRCKLANLEAQDKQHRRDKADLSRRVTVLEYGLRAEREERARFAATILHAKGGNFKDGNLSNWKTRVTKRGNKSQTLPCSERLFLREYFLDKGAMRAINAFRSSPQTARTKRANTLHAPKVSVPRTPKSATPEPEPTQTQQQQHVPATSIPPPAEQSLSPSAPTQTPTPEVEAAPTAAPVPVTPVVLGPALPFEVPDWSASIEQKWLDEHIASSRKPVASAWKPKVPLRDHLDCVRAVQFHPSDPILLTASDDGTAKVWDIVAPIALCNRKKKFKSLDPSATLRGHRGLATCVSFSVEHQAVVTGGTDGKVLLWDYAALKKESFAPLGRVSLGKRDCLDHPDSVWAVTTTKGLIITAAADAIRFWQPRPGGNSGFDHVKLAHPRGYRPATIAVMPTDPTKLLVGFDSGSVAQVDITTQQYIRTLQDPKTLSSAQRVTSLAAHPHTNLCLTGHSDNKVRFWDSRLGGVLDAIKADRGIITSVAIDQAGLQMATGSSFGVRFWDMCSRTLVQDLDPHQTHRRKFDEAVHAVAFHPAKSRVLASAGADSLVKIYTSS